MSFINVVDNRLKMENINDAKYIIKTGPRSSYTMIPPQGTSPAGATSLTYYLNAVGPNVGRNRTIWINAIGTITLTNADGSAFQNLPVPGELGFKCAPFNRCIQSVQHTIGQASEVYNVNQLIDWVTRLKSDAHCVNFFDNFQPDSVSDYASSNLATISPITPYYSVAVGDVQKSRTVGITGVAYVDAGTKLAITVSFNFWEPLITPFSSVAPRDIPALYGLDGETIQVQFMNVGLSDALAINPGSWGPASKSLINTACTLSNANMYVQYITGPEVVLPAKSLYQFPKYQVFQTSVGNVAAGTASNNNTVVVNSQTLPSKLIVFARPSETLRTSATADSYLSITALNAQLDNGLTVLNGATTRQLFDISVRNGLCSDFALWAQNNLAGWNIAGNVNIFGSGSVAVFDPSFDMSLSAQEGLTNGSSGKYTITFNVSLQNNTAATVSNVILYCFCVNDALLVRDGRNYLTQLLAYTPEQVMNASKTATFIDLEEYNEAQNANLWLSGGSFKSLFNKVVDYGKKAHGLYKDHKDTIHAIGSKAHELYKAHKGGYPLGGYPLGGARHPMHKDGMFMEYN